MFDLLTTDGAARRGRLQLPHGVVETPVFQPCGTYGSVKGMTPVDLTTAGTQMLLGNTFHLMLPMCIWLIFLFIILNSFSSGRVCPLGAFEK